MSKAECPGLLDCTARKVTQENPIPAVVPMKTICCSLNLCKTGKTSKAFRAIIRKGIMFSSSRWGMLSVFAPRIQLPRKQSEKLDSTRKVCVLCLILFPFELRDDRSKSPASKKKVGTFKNRNFSDNSECAANKLADFYFIRYNWDYKEFWTLRDF